LLVTLISSNVANRRNPYNDASCFVEEIFRTRERFFRFRRIIADYHYEYAGVT